MSRDIQRLAPEVACQIAAGEVIERPVSVIKELLDNALDAKATQIKIDVFGSGIRGIRIEDNGSGIWAEDLLLAIEPHSTSKIRTLNDLYYTPSKGFRGEALASIASVSKMSISSKPALQDHAMQLKVQSGKTSIQPVVRAQGTTIEVMDLFHNVPVRKKFLKSESIEWQAIELLVKKFSLCAPHLQISLYHEEQLILELPAASILEEHAYRIRRLWGKRFYDEAKWIDVERSGLRVWGWLGNLEDHRSQNDRLWVYLNNRIVQDKLIMHALKQVYAPLVPEGRHAQCVLYLELPFDMVDINVHPAKQEVRFEQPRLIYDFMTSSLKTIWTQSVRTDVLTSGTSQHSETIQQHLGFDLNVGKRFFLCNADFIIIHFSAQLYYLIDVVAWWNYHFQKRVSKQSFPWRSRRLAMPYLKDIPLFSHAFCENIKTKLQEFGFELDFWGDERLCIRAIPESMPQLNLNDWVKVLKPKMLLDDLSLNHLLSCCQFSAYDITENDIELIRGDLNDLDPSDTQQFARCLDSKSCRKLFK